MIGGAPKGHQFATLVLLKMQLVDFHFFILAIMYFSFVHRQSF